MPGLIELLNQNRDKTPDEIVSALSPKVFIKGEFEPWEVPSQYRGRMVHIHHAYRLNGDISRAEWWHEPGLGSSRDRRRAAAWRIEEAFSRFRHGFENNYVALHLLD
jgi:hypothetical protein